MRAVDFEGSLQVLGPILLTRRQRARDFSVLWQKMCADRRALRDANLTFVTNGDDGLIQSISDCFISSKHWHIRGYEDAVWIQRRQNREAIY